jgi:transposase
MTSRKASTQPQGKSPSVSTWEIVSATAVLGPDGMVLTEGRVVSTPDGMARHFQQLPPTRIAFEVGSHSRWMSELLTKWGHEVILANPRTFG